MKFDLLYMLYTNSTQPLTELPCKMCICLCVDCTVPQCVLLLEKELVALGAMCAASLLKEDTVLPFAGQWGPLYTLCIYMYILYKFSVFVSSL